MGFEVDKVITYMEEHEASLGSQGFTIFNEALQNAGFKCHKAKNVQNIVEWNPDSFVSEFCQFWSCYLDSISLTTKSAVHRGDIVVKRKKTKHGENNDTGDSLYFVEETKNEKSLVLTLRDIKTWQKLDFEVKSKDPVFAYTLLQLSRLGSNCFSYQYSIFRKILGINQGEIGALISLCIPGIKNKRSKECRQNTLECLFDYISGNTMQETIEIALNKKTNPISNSECDDFVMRICDLAEECRKYKIEEKNKKAIRGRFRGLNEYKAYACNFIRGNVSNQLYAFFYDKDNRRLFQYRFSCVFQLYLLLYHKDLSTIPDEPEAYDALTSDGITEYITLRKDLMDKISDVINFLSVKKERMYVQSIFHLAGFIFDSIDFDPAKTVVRKDEFRQYKENVLCYGEGTLDFFFALNRYKDSNHFAAEKLSEIYYFGREFDGYVVNRDIQKSIELLNSWKDHSESARWSLAENHTRVSEKTTDPETKKKNLDTARELYNQCSNYPPALNSKARLLISDVIGNISGFSEEEAKQKVKEAVRWAAKSAKSGWVYAFNNLYAWLTKKEISMYLDQADLDEAYSAIIPITDSINTENEICDVKRRLKEGIVRELETYAGEFVQYEFKYYNPIEKPVNFLVVSAYLGNLYGINHLGLEIVDKERKNAKKLFEHAAKYGKWGYKNLATHFYKKDKAISKLLNDKADEIEKKVEQWRYYTFPLS